MYWILSLEVTQYRILWWCLRHAPRLTHALHDMWGFDINSSEDFCKNCKLYRTCSVFYGIFSIGYKTFLLRFRFTWSLKKANLKEQKWPSQRTTQVITKIVNSTEMVSTGPRLTDIPQWKEWIPSFSRTWSFPRNTTRILRSKKKNVHYTNKSCGVLYICPYLNLPRRHFLFHRYTGDFCNGVALGFQWWKFSYKY